MKNRMLAVRAAAMAAAAVAVIVAAAPAGAMLRDGGWDGGHLSVGRGHQTTLLSSATMVSAKRSILAFFLTPLRDWDIPNVLPAPVVEIAGDF